MKPVRDINPVRLPARTVHCVEEGKGLEITAVSGTVWITQACDRRDVILTRGQFFILDRQGRAVVYALKDAAIVVGLPAASKPPVLPPRLSGTAPLVPSERIKDSLSIRRTQ